MATTPVFLPGKSHGQRSLAGYSPWGCKRVGHNEVTNTFTFLPPIIILTDLKYVCHVYKKVRSHNRTVYFNQICIVCFKLSIYYFFLVFMIP